MGRGDVSRADPDLAAPDNPRNPGARAKRAVDAFELTQRLLRALPTRDPRRAVLTARLTIVAT